ncbi:hypothetical protein SKAU_G00089440 [Synaphobranchus kaupii]|uniref:Uncharacterized protein n=1 Tax=Synaphobranchus kaupii TaxID=118154 RepID=A0A9Q1FXA4_SYNKA|nr:hypothetical protein SKAU_G00089440 [Synaphobranchus kaupii]
MESRLEELRQVFVKSEREAAEHGSWWPTSSTAAQQGELFVAENSQRLKKTLRFKKHRPSIVFSSMLGPEDLPALARQAQGCCCYFDVLGVGVRGVEKMAFGLTGDCDSGASDEPET